MKRLTVQSGQAELAVQVSGDGPALVFLHSGVTDGRAWTAQAEHFSPHFEVVTYDGRGHGQTVFTPEPHSLSADLRAVIDALDLQKAVLIGNSKGGRVALDFALEYPERVRGLVLVGSAISGQPKWTDWPAEVLHVDELGNAAEAAGDRKRQNELEAWMWLDGPTSPEGRVGGPLRDFFLEMNEQILRAGDTGEELAGPPAYPRLHEVACPALLVVGELDLPNFRAHAEHAAREIPAGEFRLMPGTAHFPALEQPAAFNALLDDFLQRLP